MANPTDFFAPMALPIDHWTDVAVQWLATHWRPIFQVMRPPLAAAIDWLAGLLTSTHPLLILLLLFVIAWQLRGIKSAIICVVTMLALGLLGVWQDAMSTLALVIVSVAICSAIGFPLGIVAARSNYFERLSRPFLDTMQTLPAFVYLVPVVLLVGIGDLPGIIVTAVFAIPPIVRLTSLGIRGIPVPIIEAAEALGSTSSQLLFKVQIPLALPSILLGLNQTIMMALAMVTYAAMIGVGGLGQLVLRGIGRLDMGLATMGGLGIVVLAMVFGEIMAIVGGEAPTAPTSEGAAVTPYRLIVRSVRRLNAALLARRHEKATEEGYETSEATIEHPRTTKRSRSSGG
jgi:glycine betaine/proline transport system permease protein